MTESIKEILTHFSIELNPSSYGNGHINDTYLVATDPSYILQKINKNVFKKPEEVMENIKLVTEHLRRKIIAEGGDPMRETLNLIETVDGKPYYRTEDGEYYRMYVFVDGARSYDVVESPEQLYNAAKAFGKFQNMLADFPAEKLYEVIPRFHDTRKRYADFLAAVEADSAGRAAGAAREIQFVKDREDAVGVVVDDIASGRLPVRVTHNDTTLTPSCLGRSSTISATRSALPAPPARRTRRISTRSGSIWRISRRSQRDSPRRSPPSRSGNWSCFPSP